MNRRKRARLGTAVGVAALTALAACGGGGDDKAAQTTPTPAITPTPIPMGSPTAAADDDEEAASPFLSLAVPESVAAAYALAWADEFTGKALGPEWVFRPVIAPNRACSPPAEGQTTVSGGFVNLSVIRDPSKTPNVTKACPDGQYLNAMIGTAAAKSFQYGVLAARIKFHADQGAHGSFWMQPLAKAGGDPTKAADAGAEIDISEYFGEGFDKSSLTSFIHFHPPGQKPLRAGGYVKNMDEIFGDELPSDDYHVYSVEWTAKEYVFRVDGIETFRTSKAVSAVPQYFILSMLSSDYEIPKITDDVLPLTMSVDWVRAWQK